MSGLRVFLSSTATDLVAHRRVADDTLLRLQQQSVVMERFGPLPNIPLLECEALAASCDLVVCIVAHRYGYEPDPNRGSITRREVEAARRSGKPVYAWIVDDKYPWTEAKEQDRLIQPDVLSDPIKQAEVIAALKGLLDFKAWLRREMITDSFTTADDLGRKIATALARVPSRGTAVPKQSPELRVVHALQPAPHFRGRESLVERLASWVTDTASSDRVHSLVAAGGTGKTAIAEQVVSRLQRQWPLAGTGSVLIWSFYERPDADAFLHECVHLFLGEADNQPAGGRLERLLRGLRDGRPHLIILDGLERVQSEGSPWRARGELEDHTLKLLLQAIANGLGRTRALLTSRFALIDLRDWSDRGVVETILGDLPIEDARMVLRCWGVLGPDYELDAVAEQVGRHALSVAVIGSYLSHFESGRIESVASLKLDSIVGDDPKAAKLARVLASYAQRLPPDERELLTRLSVFPRGISIEILEMLVEAGGQVAGVLATGRQRLQVLLARLVERGLVFRYRGMQDRTLTWTAHPFVRQTFADLLDCPAESVFMVVASRLDLDLGARPEAWQGPSKTEMLDRYEQLIETKRLANMHVEALDIYRNRLGGFGHVGSSLGEYSRGYRILHGFVPPHPHPDPYALPRQDLAVVLNELSLYATRMGRLDDAWNARQQAHILFPKRDRAGLRDSLLNLSELAFDKGRLSHALSAADEAIVEAEAILRAGYEDANDQEKYRNAIAARANANHRRGNVAAAREDFALVESLQDEILLRSAFGQWQARHHLDLGERVDCLLLVQAGLHFQRSSARELVSWNAMFARLRLFDRQDPAAEIVVVRDWTARTGDMRLILEMHELAAHAALLRGDLVTASAEADDGLRQARLCGYLLRQIDLLATMSAIHLAWPDADRALTTAREAFELATAAECGYAWGAANAALAMGQAFRALGQHENAQNSFDRATLIRH